MFLADWWISIITSKYASHVMRTQQWRNRDINSLFCLLIDIHFLFSVKHQLADLVIRNCAIPVLSFSTAQIILIHLLGLVSQDRLIRFLFIIRINVAKHN